MHEVQQRLKLRRNIIVQGCHSCPWSASLRCINCQVLGGEWIVSC